jgi:predicted ATPase
MGRAAATNSADPRQGAPDTGVFGRQVRDALLHLHDLPYLQRHPFVARMQRLDGGGAAAAAKALQARLLEAVDGLRPGDDVPAAAPAWRRHRLVALRYVEGLDVAAACRQLGISPSEYHREHRLGLAAIVAALQERTDLGAPGAPSVAGGPGEDAAPAAGEVRRQNLPIQVTSFVGREAETLEVQGLLTRTRLLTLTGTGGCGKTRLALQVAGDQVDAYPDGVWFVDLAPLADAALVPGAVAAALSVREEPGRPIHETLLDRVRSRRLLLVLDNCEHLVEACARLVDGLVRAGPDVRVLATSREPLGIAGEVVWRVPSLPVPDAARSLRDGADLVVDLSRSAASRLFLARAAAAHPTWRLTERNAPAVARVCQRLDGMPLAIELAAARVRALSVEQIADRLDDRFRLLTGGSRTALPRQQTLRATLDWSHDLLSEAERALVRRLSAFAGGWTLEAAEAVCADGSVPPGDVLDLLAGLVDKSLVVPEEHEGEVRYRLLETIRQYAERKRLDAGEEAAVGARHRDWYLELAERADEPVHGPEQRRWLERLERDHDNLRAALGWCLGAGQAEPGLRMASALFFFWYYRGHQREAAGWFKDLLALSQGSIDDPRLRAARSRAIATAGWVRVVWTALGLAAPAAEEAVATLRSLGERSGLVTALITLGTCRVGEGRHAEARELFEEALAVARRASLQAAAGHAASFLAGLAFDLGDLVAARSRYEEMLAHMRDAGGPSGIALALEWLGRVALVSGQPHVAGARYAEALSICRDVDDPVGVAHAQQGLGWVALERGDWSEAERRLRECLTLQRETRDWFWLGGTLDGLAGVAALRADGIPAAERALRLAGAASAIREANPGWRRWSESTTERWLAPAFAALGGRGAPAAAAAWAAGRAMTADEAVAFALAIREGDHTSPLASRVDHPERRPV